MDMAARIKHDIESNPVILFMKGSPDAPRCGFSQRAVQVLEYYGITYETVDILADPQLRVKLSEYSNWPTIPQLFVNSELIGGADIMLELHQHGQLLPILEQAVVPAGS